MILFNYSKKFTDTQIRTLVNLLGDDAQDKDLKLFIIDKKSRFYSLPYLFNKNLRKICLSKYHKGVHGFFNSRFNHIYIFVQNIENSIERKLNDGIDQLCDEKLPFFLSMTIIHEFRHYCQFKHDPDNAIRDYYENEYKERWTELDADDFVNDIFNLHHETIFDFMNIPFLFSSTKNEETGMISIYLKKKENVSKGNL